MLHAITVSYLLSLIINNVFTVPQSGPYDIFIKKVESCEDEGSGLLHFSTKIGSAGNKKYIYSEQFRLGIPIDKDFTMKVEVQQMGNGGWKGNFIRYTAKGCNQLWKYLEDFIKTLMASAGVHVEECPIPMGNYTANDWEVKLDLHKQFPVVTYGVYRGILNSFYKGDKVGCIMIYAETVPKD